MKRRHGAPARKCRRCPLRYVGPLPTCAPCRLKVADLQRDYYRDLRAAGLCTDCKAPSAAAVRCRPCAAENRRRCRLWRAKQRRYLNWQSTVNQAVNR